MGGSEVQFEDWHVTIQVIAFVVIFLAFCYFTVRTLFMKREKEKRMAAMPLDDDSASEATPQTRNGDPEDPPKSD